ncbi:hypothetical protein C8Q76DRAFT_754556 [Earliella scabrosa]|nr:hypothetical protein C8Q76DRAFT_754556 [Earliella scabrosa]
MVCVNTVDVAPREIRDAECLGPESVYYCHCSEDEIVSLAFASESQTIIAEMHQCACTYLWVVAT